MSLNVQRKEHGKQRCFAFLYSNAQGCILSVFILLFTVVFYFSFSSVFFGLLWSTLWFVLSQKELCKPRRLQSGTQKVYLVAHWFMRVWKSLWNWAMKWNIFSAQLFAHVCYQKRSNFVETMTPWNHVASLNCIFHKCPALTNFVAFCSFCSTRLHYCRRCL